MLKNHPISDLFKRNRVLVSVEFFPPKNENGGEQILSTAGKLKDMVQPDFVSITYGAGGSTRELTYRYANILKDRFDFEVMPHLTCVGSTREELRSILEGYQQSGFRNIMALRGDPPKGERQFKKHPNGLEYASDLVDFIRKEFPEICLGVAGYPEKHPEAIDLNSDLEHLKQKVDKGASFITTQLFFENQHYFDFVARCRKVGIKIPIIPGILPVISLSQLERFCQMCGASIPEALKSQLESTNDPERIESIGIEWATQQVKQLLAQGVPGIHLYILNRSRSALELCQSLKNDNCL